MPEIRPLVDSEDPVANLLCEQEPRLSETYESVTAARTRRSQRPIMRERQSGRPGTLNLLGF